MFVAVPIFSSGARTAGKIWCSKKRQRVSTIIQVLQLTQSLPTFLPLPFPNKNKDEMSARFPSFSKQKKTRNVCRRFPGFFPPTLRNFAPKLLRNFAHLHGRVAQIRTGAAEVATKLLADLVVRGWKGGVITSSVGWNLLHFLIDRVSMYTWYTYHIYNPEFYHRYQKTLRSFQMSCPTPKP